MPMQPSPPIPQTTFAPSPPSLSPPKSPLTGSFHSSPHAVAGAGGKSSKKNNDNKNNVVHTCTTEEGDGGGRP